MAEQPSKRGFYDNIESQGPNVSELTSPKRRTSPQILSVQKTLSDISSGLRILEDRYNNLRKKVQLTDQTMLEAQRTFQKEKRLLHEELVETKMHLQELIEDLKIMKGELNDAVKHKDFKVLEKYLDMWDPMQFVTRNEVEKLIEEKFPEKDNIED